MTNRIVSPTYLGWICALVTDYSGKDMEIRLHHENGQSAYCLISGLEEASNRLGRADLISKYLRYLTVSTAGDKSRVEEANEAAWEYRCGYFAI